MTDSQSQGPRQSNDPSYTPWLAARERFVSTLSENELKIYESATLENIYYRTSNAQRSHEEQSYARSLSRKLAPLTDALVDYGQALDVIANSSSLYICPVWGALRVVLCGLQNLRKYCGKISDQLERIGDMLPRLSAYRRLFPDDPILFSSLTSAYLVILRFCCEVNEVFLRPGKHSATVALLKRSWKTCQPKLDDSIRELRRYRNEVDRNVQLIHMQQEQEFRSRAQRFQQMQVMRLEEDKRTRLLRLLSDDEYKYKHVTVRETRQPQTCEWLLNDPLLLNWMSSDEASCFVLYGIPGCGKTVLTCAVIEHYCNELQDQCEGVCYYYFDYANLQSLKPTNVLRACLRQLVEARKTPPTLKERIQEFADSNHPFTYHETLELFSSVVARLQRCLIILDGFDELHESDRALMYKATAILSEKTSSAKIFITCRHGSNYGFRSTHHITVTHDKIARDLDSYVRSSVEEACSGEDPCRQLTLRSPTLKGKIIDRLLQKAEGMFLLVKYQLLELCSATTDDEVHQALLDLPQSLIEVYDRILARVQSSVNGERKLSTAKRVLAWIAHAKRPLTLEELREAVGLSLQDTTFDWRSVVEDDEKLLHGCRGMLIVDHTRKTVQLAHATIKEYLSSSRSTHGLHDGSRDFIARLCLHYFFLNDFQRQMTTFIDPTVTVDVGMFEEMAWQNGSAAWRPLHWLYGKSGKKQGQTSSQRFEMDTLRPQHTAIGEFSQYALLSYIRSYWHAHAKDVSLKDDPIMMKQLAHLVFEARLPFLFRPWEEPEHVSLNGIIREGDFEIDCSDVKDKALWVWIITNGNDALCEVYLQKYAQSSTLDQIYSRHPPRSRVPHNMLQFICRMGYLRLYQTIFEKIDSSFWISHESEEYEHLAYIKEAAEHSTQMLEAVWSCILSSNGSHLASRWWLRAFTEVNSESARAAFCEVTLSKSVPTCSALLGIATDKIATDPTWVSMFTKLLNSDSGAEIMECIMLVAVEHGNLPLLLETLHHNPTSPARNAVWQLCVCMLNDEADEGSLESMMRRVRALVCREALEAPIWEHTGGLYDIFEDIKKVCHVEEDYIERVRHDRLESFEDAILCKKVVDVRSGVNGLTPYILLLGYIDYVLRTWQPSDRHQLPAWSTSFLRKLSVKEESRELQYLATLTEEWGEFLYARVVSRGFASSTYVDCLTYLFKFDRIFVSRFGVSFCCSQPWVTRASDAMETETSSDAAKFVSLLFDHEMIHTREHILSLRQTAMKTGSFSVKNMITNRFLTWILAEDDSFASKKRVLRGSSLDFKPTRRLM